MKFASALALIALALVSFKFAAAQKREAPVISKGGLNSALTSSMGCTSFRWINAEGISDKAALQVPITLDGKQYWFQLDTGSPFTYIYGSLATSRGWKAVSPAGGMLPIPAGVKGGARAVRVPGGSIGGLKLPVLQLISMQEDEANHEPSGTLGLDVLDGYIVLLDFPGGHFCVMPRADFPSELDSKTAWIPAQIRNGSLRFEVKVGDERLDVLYDTGSSWQDLVLDWDRWKNLTGASGETDAKRKVEGRSWGGNLKIFGAPLKGELRLGALRFQHLEATSTPTGANDFKNSGFDGMLGNALFFNDVVVLDLGIMPAFGVITTQ
jgi:hypothetical protein